MRDIIMKFPTYYVAFLVSVFNSIHAKESPLLLMAARTDIEVISITSGKQSSLVGSLVNAIAIDYDYQEQQIFFNDEGQDKIFFVKYSVSTTGDLFTTTLPEMIINNTNKVEDIAYDWVHDVLYWTGAGRGTIELMTMKGRHHLTLVDDNLRSPRGIAVDPRKDQRWVYWTDWYDKPKIERAGLDGSHRTLLVATDLGWPNYLTIDYADNRLYWTDGMLDSISSCDLNGQNAREVFSDARFTRHPFTIDIFRDMMYWLDWRSNEIYVADKNNGSLNLRTISHAAKTPFGLKVYHRSRKPEVPGLDPCGVNNGGCSHICLAAPAIGSSKKKFSCFSPNTGHSQIQQQILSITFILIFSMWI